jgi:hypothetical protein
MNPIQMTGSSYAKSEVPIRALFDVATFHTAPRNIDVHSVPWNRQPIKMLDEN